MALYAELAEHVPDAALSRDYWIRSAKVQERRGDVDRAARAYHKVLQRSTRADAEGLAALEQLFTRTRRWDDLIGVVERRIEQASDAKQREALYATIAGIYDAQLGRPEDAVLAYRKVLELDPTSTRALRALDDLFSRQKMWTELAENLEGQLELVPDDDAQLALMLRLARLHETEMGLVDVAIEGYRRVLERDPSNVQGLAALERLGADPKYELAIADLLEPLYRHLGDWQKLVGVHEVQVRRTDDPARRVELLHQIGQLYEDAAGDLGSACPRRSPVLLREDPANEGTQQQIDRLALRTGRFADLAWVLGGAWYAGRRSRPGERALHDRRACLRGRSRRRRYGRSACIGVSSRLTRSAWPLAEWLERPFWKLWSSTKTSRSFSSESR